MIVSVPGADLFYTAHGVGPACLVLSGIGTAAYERQIPPPLADRFRFVYVDLRGSGRSTGEPTALGFDGLADDLEAVRADLGLERIAVLGHSILGMVAIEYGRRRPAGVSHVIAVGTPPHGDMARLAAEAAAFFDADADEERKRLLADNVAALPADASPLARVLAQTPTRFFDPRFDAAPLFADVISRPALLQHLMGTLGPGWDVAAGEIPIRVPVLLAQGRYDYVAPHILWNGIAETLPTVTRQLFERSGHQPFFEEPERFAEAVTSWMRAVA